jgi:hypothetical protein
VIQSGPPGEDQAGSLEVVLGQQRASARHGAIQMPTLNQLAGLPAKTRGDPMLKLSVQYGKLKINVTVPVTALISLLILLQ